MKRDLHFSRPVTNAAGTLGFAPEPQAGVSLESLGAFVTNPLSLRPRLPAAEPKAVEYPGGVLLHTGLPNPGFQAVSRRYAARWKRSALPIIVHLMADRPEETQTMVRNLESQENIMAAELGFAPLLADDILMLTLEMCRGELPLIFALPVEQVLSLGPRLIQAGAQAISLSPARGALPDQGSSIVMGRLYGRSLFPRTLEVVYSAARIGLPVIAAGGVWSEENINALLGAGALAVQVDVALWGLSF